MNKQILAAAAAACACASAATAAPTIFDGYLTGSTPANGEYAAGTALNLQPATLANAGFVNGPYSGGTTTSQFAASATGIDYANVTHESGGSVLYAASARDNTVRTRARNLGNGATAAGFNTTTNNVFYSSVMLQRSNLPTAALSSSFVGVGFSNSIAPTLTTTGVLGGFYVGFSGSTAGDASANFGSLVLRSRSGSSTTAAADTILVDGAATSTVGATYFVVLKSTVNGPTDAIEYWVNPGDVATEATMTSTSLVHGVLDATNGGGYQYQGGTVDFTRLSYSSYNWDGNVRFDEPRVGTALRDVAVPEPTTLAAAAGGLIALARHRRRRA